MDDVVVENNFVAAVEDVLVPVEDVVATEDVVGMGGVGAIFPGVSSACFVERGCRNEANRVAVVGFLAARENIAKEAVEGVTDLVGCAETGSGCDKAGCEKAGCEKAG